MKLQSFLSGVGFALTFWFLGVLFGTIDLQTVGMHFGTYAKAVAGSCLVCGTGFALYRRYCTPQYYDTTIYRGSEGDHSASNTGRPDSPQ